MEIEVFSKEIEDKKIIDLVFGKKAALIIRVENVSKDAFWVVFNRDSKEIRYKFPKEYGSYFKFEDSYLNDKADALASSIKRTQSKEKREQKKDYEVKPNTKNDRRTQIYNTNSSYYSAFSPKPPISPKKKNFETEDKKPTNSFIVPPHYLSKSYDQKSSPIDNEYADIGDTVLLICNETKEKLLIVLDKSGRTSTWNGTYFVNGWESRFDELLENGARFIQVDSALGAAVYKREKSETITLNVNGLFTHYKILDITKGHYSKEEKKTVESIIKDRGITELTHFTRIENLPSIIDWGAIVPRSMHKEAEISAIYSDDGRYDNRLGCTSLSVSFPNPKMFYLKRQEEGAIYAVITFDSSFLYSPDCMGFHFYTGNAAARDSESGSTPEDFEKMFTPEGRKSTLPAKYATSSQAEVMIDGFIPTSYIKTIEVNTLEIAEKVKDMLAASKFSTKVKADVRFFDNKAQFKIWEG